jgi:hypothetical protein
MITDSIPLTRVEKYLYYLLYGNGFSSGGSSGSGGNTQTDNPHHILITTPPTKTEYEEGETLDFTGIEVTIYKKDDSVWTDTTHPQGKALFSELEFPVTVATLPEEGD